MAKAKLIKSTEGQKSNPTGKWYVHDQIKPFIQGIMAGDIDLAQVSSTLISGVPTPWARAKLFWFAFDYNQRQDANIETSGLIQFYNILIEEWKGLMALIALYPDRISFSEPINMDPAGRDLYNIASAFGRMLMEDADLWINQDAKQTNPDEKPFVQLIKYKNQVIGATSPFSIVFPGVEYKKLQQASDIKWYREGKFIDPMPFLDPDKLQKLYLFLKNINKNFVDFQTRLNLGRTTNPLDINGLKNYLREWQQEVKKKVERERDVQEYGTVARYSNLSMPYKGLLDAEQKVYQRLDGSLTFTHPQGDLKAEISDLQSILMDSKKIIGWFESNDFSTPLSGTAVHYLKVNDVRDKEVPYKYFALPLSMDGIKMFNLHISSLLYGMNKNFNIEGSISDQGNLIVDLTLEIDGQPQKLNSKEYEIEWLTQNNKVMMWPNFISENWNAYYLYSEFPLNVQGLKFVPFFKICQAQKIIEIERQHGPNKTRNVVYSNSDELDRRDSGLEIANLVSYPVGLVSQEMHKYEVIKSNKPIAGLEIRIETAGQTQVVGYLLVKNPDDETMGNNKIKDLSTEAINSTAIVGIDFGSNNSCVYYRLTTASNSDAKPIKFENRRLALVGIDSPLSTIAERDELLFFSNEPTPNGQVKSWLHEHDSRYIGFNKDKEIAGGVAVNEKNILVKEMDREKITTQAGTLHYNMKWLAGESGLSKKTAYLKALWLNICADLYAQKTYPVQLRWSFPSSMSSSDIRLYDQIYRVQLQELTPISDYQTKFQIRINPDNIIEQTEAESVCRYALTQDYGLNDNIFLGIDVGGSTSDILLLAQDITRMNKPHLFKQSSVRIAAGVFFDAVIKSATFRRAIYNYHQQQNKINVENIQEILTEGYKAPFYLNSVFDQLTEKDFPLFYTYIGREASFVYSIPAYVTGLLLYYSGKLTAKTIKENNLASAKNIHLMPFGKGGRLFHWLEILLGRLASGYWERCFRAGFGEGGENLNLRYRSDISVDNKSEVSKGLVVVSDELIYEREVRFKSDIFAEKGIRYLRNGQYEEFSEDENVESEYFEQVTQFIFPDRFENFEEFLRIFIDFVGHETGLVKNIAVLENRSSELKDFLSHFIKNDSEFLKAIDAKKESNKFEYRFPIFIAEGLCYLEKILIPEVFKS